MDRVIFFVNQSSLNENDFVKVVLLDDFLRFLIKEHLTTTFFLFINLFQFS